MFFWGGSSICASNSCSFRDSFLELLLKVFFAAIYYLHKISVIKNVFRGGLFMSLKPQILVMQSSYLGRLILYGTWLSSLSILPHFHQRRRYQRIYFLPFKCYAFLTVSSHADKWRALGDGDEFKNTSRGYDMFTRVSLIQSTLAHKTSRKINSHHFHQFFFFKTCISIAWWQPVSRNSQNFNDTYGINNGSRWTN